MRMRWLATLAAVVVSVAALNAGKAGADLPRGGELRFAIHAEPKTLDPHLVEDEASEAVQYLTAGVLVRQNRLTQELEPALATSWKVVDGGRGVEFRLRTGVRFSDGTPFSAADVAYTIRRINDPVLHSPIAETLRSGKGDITAEVRSPSVVIVRGPQPVAGLPGLFDQLPIVSAKSPKAVLGPFEIAEYKAGSYLVLRRNPNYWKRDVSGRPLPYLDSVRLDILTNIDMELMRFRRGESELVQGLDAENFARLSTAMGGAARDLGPGLDAELVWFNQVATSPLPAYKKEWFRNVEFRRAVSAAINRSDICRLVFRGHASPAAGPVSPANRMWANTRLKAPEYSAERALALLSKAGFQRRDGTLYDRGGHAIEFSVITNAGSKTRERIAALMQQDLAKIGIRLNVVPMDFPSLIERITRTFNYEACLLGQNMDLDPNGNMNVWRSSAPMHAWNPNQKKPETQWEAEIDRLLDVQASTMDQAKRKAAYDRVQEIVAAEQPFTYLVYKSVLAAISPRLLNAKPAILRPQTFWNIDVLALSTSASR